MLIDLPDYVFAMLVSTRTPLGWSMMFLFARALTYYDE